MNKNNIKIIQNILKKQNNFKLALKLENAYYEHETCTSWNDEHTGKVDFYVHPNDFLELQSLNNDETHILGKLLSGIHSEYHSGIEAIEFYIDKEINYIEDVGDVTYIFVDESGDMNFSAGGSQYYMFHFLIKKRPFTLHEHISSYRYELLEKNLDPLSGNRLNIEYFHACNDNKHIKNELFNIISTFDKNSVEVYSYILEKDKVHPDKRKTNEVFYIDNLTYSISKLLEKIKIDGKFIIITDRLPVNRNVRKQEKALKAGITEYVKANKLDLRYDIFHHSSASSANLQIIDYIGWAIFRKYTLKDDKYYEKIKHCILEEEVVTQDRDTRYYEK
ncbi:MAG: hypothetical protein GQ474_05650 [Sulfurimonas sp.]|nr:hypothetical protein [Sulfurimonas sp.]